VPFIAPFTGAQALRDPFNRLVFHVRASYFDETARIVNQLVATGTRKIAVFHQNDSYGQAGLEGVTRALKAHNLEPVAVGTVERNSVDVQAAVTKLMAGSPEAIVQISAYKSCAACIRAARKASYVGQFYNVSFVGTQALAGELGNEARGVVVAQVMPYPFTPVSALATEFLSAIGSSQFDIEANYSSMEGFVAAKTLIEGLKRAGRDSSREGLIAGMEAMRDVDLGGFFVDFSAKKHTGSSFVELTVLTQDGKVRR
jgi:branched-chain amino acid transport system substrate-binding protein